MDSLGFYFQVSRIIFMDSEPVSVYHEVCGKAKTGGIREGKDRRNREGKNRRNRPLFGGMKS